MTQISLDEARAALRDAGGLWLEMLRSTDLSVGLYSLPAGSKDPQSPHTEDEVYFVISGAAKMQNGSDTLDVSAGDVIYVAKNIEHRFFEITQDLELLVFFAPAESSNSAE